MFPRRGLPNGSLGLYGTSFLVIIFLQRVLISTLCAVTQYSQQTFVIFTIIIPILYMNKLKYRKDK